MGKEKKTRGKKTPLPLKNESFLRNWEKEDEMHCDHGPVIIGRRDKKPKIPEEKEEK